MGTSNSPAATNTTWKMLIVFLCVLILGLYTLLPHVNLSDEPSGPQTEGHAMQKIKTTFFCEGVSSILPSGTPQCTEPVTKVVFIKTHKTASTTLASIIERFGYTRNLSFALGNTDHVLADQDLFTRSLMKQSPPPLDGSPRVYDLLTNHARYNRPEMDAVVPGAKYITILREPSSQLESAFAYFKMADSLNLSNHRNALQIFMKNPTKYLDKKFFFWWQARNGQIFDLGLEHRHSDDEFTVNYKIRQLDHEMDMVLITEHIDESLLLLRKHLCWDLDDILYISNNIRSKHSRYKINTSLQIKMRQWNSADAKLYQHFNRTLWKKVADYGPSFQTDLEAFRKRQRDVLRECVERDTTFEQNEMEERFKLKANSSSLCTNLWRGDKTFTTLLRKKQTKGRVLSLS